MLFCRAALSFNITDAVSEELPERFHKVVATTQSDKAVSSLQLDNTEDFLFGDIYIMHPREWISHNTQKIHSCYSEEAMFQKNKSLYFQLMVIISLL